MFELKRTPFHERTSKLGLPQNWRRWAGYLVVGSYELTLDRGHEAKLYEADQEYEPG